MKHKHQQILKFILLIILSAVGLVWFFLGGGSLLKAICLYVVFKIIGMTSMIAYHRWMAHNHIEPKLFGKCVLLYCVVCSSLTKPLQYIYGHRLHHRYPDSENDPHPPSIGFWNALIGNFNEPKVTVRITDVLRRREIVFVDKYMFVLYSLNLVLWWVIDSDVVLLSFAFLNLRQLVNATMFNYFGHGGSTMTGPTNTAWYTGFVFSFGEQFHKNHHNDPSNPNMGCESWYNFDLTYWVLSHLTTIRKVDIIQS